MELKEWADIIDGFGTIGVLIFFIYTYKNDNANTKDELEKSRTKHISDIKSSSEQFASLLEKSLIALQDNQRFIEDSVRTWKEEINVHLTSIKEKLNK